MTLVVADTGPLNYLHLIGKFDLLRDLYSEVFVPPAVIREMSHSKAPPGLQAIAAIPPRWLRIRAPINPVFLDQLDDGEAEAISLAMELKADRVLIDERDGRRSALALGFQISGTLGILEEAAEKKLIRLEEALNDLRKTTFRAEVSLYDAALKRDRDRRSRPA